MERKDLQDLKQFPLVFKLCFRPGFKADALKGFGYNNMEDYFWGTMDDNISNVGWAGRERDRAVRTPADVYSNLTAGDVKAHIDSISIFTGTYANTGNVVNFGPNLQHVIVDTWINWFDNCVLVDFLKDETLRREGISTIYFYFSSRPLSVNIIPEDRNLVTERALQNNMLYYFGPTVEMSIDTPEGSYDNYIMELKQEVYVEHDQSKNCMNYPNKTYESYNACDKAYVKRMLASHYGPGLVPLWAADRLDNVTTSFYVDWSYDYGPLYDGSKISNCPLPCTTTSVNARFLARYQVTYPWLAYYLFLIIIHRQVVKPVLH
jgi:hypothetical protein